MFDLTQMSPVEIIFLSCEICVLFTAFFTAQLLSQYLFSGKYPKERKASHHHTHGSSVCHYLLRGFVGLSCKQGIFHVSRVDKKVLRGLGTCLANPVPHAVRLDQFALKLLKYWMQQFVAIRPLCSILMIGIVLGILVLVGDIKSPHPWSDVEHIEEGIQNILVCIETVAFSIIQRYACSVEPCSGQVSKWKLKKDE